MKNIKILVALFIVVSIFTACSKPEVKTEGTPAEKNQTQEKTEVKEEMKEEKKEEPKQEAKAEMPLEKLTFVLDWVPNTNHTGLFVAKDNGYFAEENLEVEIIQPAEDSSATIVGLGKAEFGISFQPNMVKRLKKDVPITAVAAVLQHNTAGIMSLKEKGIATPKDMPGKKYSTWEDPIDDATIQAIVEKDGGDWSKVEFISGEFTDATTALRLNLFDSIFVYQGWDKIHADIQKVETNFFLLTDYMPEFDYYSPVIIANNDFLANKPEVARRVLRAIKKGYEFAAEKPAEAAEILIKNAPEGNAELIRASQEYVSTQYIADAKSWGVIDRNRWNAFYKWLYEKQLVEMSLEDKGFSTDYLE